MPAHPKIRVRPAGEDIVRAFGSRYRTRSLEDIATALLRIGERHAAELADELAAMPPARTAQDPETGMFKKSEPTP